MCLEIVVLTTHCHPASFLGAGNVTGIRGTKGLNHLSFQNGQTDETSY